MPALLITDRLPETDTRKDWTFTYVASTSPEVLADGSLTVTEHTGVRVKRTISHRYAVQETAGHGGRCFLLLLEDRTGDLDTAAGRAGKARVGEVYECRVGVARPSCTCPGFVAGKRTCKHMIALDSLVSSGGLPDPCESGMDRYDDPRESFEEMPEDVYEDMYGHLIAIAR